MKHTNLLLIHMNMYILTQSCWEGSKLDGFLKRVPKVIQELSGIQGIRGGIQAKTKTKTQVRESKSLI